jgi:integrase/recombinase XerD
MENTTLIGLPKTRITTPAELAAAGYLARYRGGTRETYRVSLKILWDWCAASAWTSWRACAGRCWNSSPATSRTSVTTRRPPSRTTCPSSAASTRSRRSTGTSTAPGRAPADAPRVPGRVQDAGPGPDGARLPDPDGPGLLAVMDAALITLMGMLGLRVSEACAVKIEDYQDIERGHRVLRLVGKGGKPATIPLPVPVLRALDAAAGDRTSGPAAAAQQVRPAGEPEVGGADGRPGCARRPASGRTSRPHGLRHSSSRPAWTPACRCVTCRSPPGTRTRGSPPGTTGPGTTTTGMFLAAVTSPPAAWLGASRPPPRQGEAWAPAEHPAPRARLSIFIVQTCIFDPSHRRTSAPG